MEGIFSFDKPEFLLAEFPIKNNSLNDDRLFIIHQGITLIEIIHTDIFPNPQLLNFHKKFSYNEVEFILAYHTDNSGYYNLSSEELLDRSAEWYMKYVIWENKNIDRNRNLPLN